MSGRLNGRLNGREVALVLLILCAATFAVGQDMRIERGDAARRANNLSDLTDKPAALTNLGGATSASLTAHEGTNTTHGAASLASAAALATHETANSSVHGCTTVASEATISAHEINQNTHGCTVIGSAAALTTHEGSNSTHGATSIASQATVDAHTGSNAVHGCTNVASQATIDAHTGSNATHGCTNVASTTWVESGVATLSNKTIGDNVWIGPYSGGVNGGQKIVRLSLNNLQSASLTQSLGLTAGSEAGIIEITSAYGAQGFCRIYCTGGTFEAITMWPAGGWCATASLGAPNNFYIATDAATTPCFQNNSGAGNVYVLRWFGLRP